MATFIAFLLASVLSLALVILGQIQYDQARRSWEAASDLPYWICGGILLLGLAADAYLSIKKYFERPLDFPEPECDYDFEEDRHYGLSTAIGDDVNSRR